MSTRDWVIDYTVWFTDNYDIRHEIIEAEDIAGAVVKAYSSIIEPLEADPVVDSVIMWGVRVTDINFRRRGTRETDDTREGI